VSWFKEQLHRHVAQSFEISELLYEGRTAFQAVRIFRNDTLGRVMTLDEVVQTTEADEFIYHEMISHPAILAHGAVRKVLIVGGGDGGVLEEVLKHGVEKVVQCEIDREVTELSRRHLPSICGQAFDDPRTECVFGDGARYVAETDERFELVIIDSTDPAGPGLVLFSEAFYRNCKRCMTPGGILVTQNGVPFLQRDELKNSIAAFRKIWTHGGCYFAGVPTYYCGPMALGWASDGDLKAVEPVKIAERFAKSRIETRWYNPDMHRAAFAVPQYLRDIVG
jgi:spermidine synthase